MKPAPTAAVRSRSRAWHSLVLAALVLSAGVVHQRATASGVFQSGGAWDKLATAMSGFRERLAERRSQAQAVRDSQQRSFVAREQRGFQPPWQHHAWQDGQPCETWEVTWDDGCRVPYGWHVEEQHFEEHCQHRWNGPPRHCGRWGGGW